MTLLNTFKSNILLIAMMTTMTAILSLWHHNNHALPQSDAITYLSDAYRHYINFYDKGLFIGLLDFYSNRGWRPQIFPYFSVPFWIAFGKNPFIAIICVSIFFLNLLAFYVYKLLRLSLNQFSSVICTVIIITYPLVFNYYLTFFSELAYMPIFLATIYHLHKTDNFSNIRHSVIAALFSALLIALRPAESIIFLVLAIPLNLYLSYKKGNVSFNELLKCISFSLFIFVLLFYYTYILPYGRLKLFLIPIFSYFFYLAIKSHIDRKANIALLFTLILFSSVFIYWAPAVDKLINWTIEASSGSVVKSLGVISGLSISEFAINIWESWRALLTIPILGSCILFLAANRKSFFGQKDVLLLFLTATLSLFVLILGYSLSVNDGQIGRRSLGVGLILSICFFSISLNSKFKYRSINLFALTILCFINITLLFHLASGARGAKLLNSERALDHNFIFQTSLTRSYLNLFTNLQKPFESKPDPHTILVDRLSSNICTYFLNKSCPSRYISIFVTEPVNYQGNHIDPFTSSFSSIVKGNEKKMGVGFLFAPLEEDYFDAITSRGVDFVVFQDRSDLTTSSFSATNLSHSQQFTVKLLKAYRSKNSIENFTMVDSFEINGTKLYVLKTKEADKKR
jgi:hypothetical protein